jgi:hypothetical protein
MLLTSTSIYVIIVDEFTIVNYLRCLSGCVVGLMGPKRRKEKIKDYKLIVVSGSAKNYFGITIPY